MATNKISLVENTQEVKTKEALYHKYNIVARIVTTFILAIFMFALSKLIIVWYGDDMNGLTRSVIQIISYFMLFDAGVESVYLNKITKPLKENDQKRVNEILTQYRKMIIVVGAIYFILVIAFSTIYSFVVKSNKIVTFGFTMNLVLILGFTEGVSYFTYGKRNFLLYVMHKNYIRNLIPAFIKIMVFVFAALVLYFFKPNLVKVTNGEISTFTIDPKDIAKKWYILLVFGIIAFEKIIYGIYAWNYFRIHYPWINFKDKEAKLNKNEVMKMLSTGLGLKVGSLILFSTDELTLSLLSHKSNAVYALSLVSIYAMYSSIINIFRRLVTQLLYTNKVKISRMHTDFDEAVKDMHFKTHVLALATLAFSFLFTPFFVKYFFSTPGSSGYWNLPLAAMMATYSYLFILRTPILIKWELQGNFKKIIILTLIEAFINLVLSLSLVWTMNIIGVTLATLIAGVTFFFMIEFQQWRERYGSIFNCHSKFKTLGVIIVTMTITIFMIVFSLTNFSTQESADGQVNISKALLVLDISIMITIPTIFIIHKFLFKGFKKFISILKK